MANDRGDGRDRDASAAAKRPETGAQAEAFRERIVQASTELIREQGLSALSMREVARRAGVSHQAPYYYFADREAIIGAIAEQGFRIMRDYVERSARAAGATPLGAIIASGRAYLEFALENPEHFRVMFRRELVAPERHPNVVGEGMHACETFYRIVDSAVAADLPAEPNVDSFFLLCWSVVHGLACLTLDGPLDIVMPDVDRKAQLAEALRAFERLMEAAVAQARVRTEAPSVQAGGDENATRKPAKRKQPPKRSGRA